MNPVFSAERYSGGYTKTDGAIDWADTHWPFVRYNSTVELVFFRVFIVEVDHVCHVTRVA